MQRSPSTEPLDDLPPLDEEPPAMPHRRAAPAKRGRRAVRSSTSSSGDSKEARLKQIRQDLDAAFVMLGTALVAVGAFRVTGTTMIARSGQGSDIVVNIARKDERVLRALLAVSKYAVYGDLVLFVGALAIALSVDVGAQSPDSFIAQRLIGQDILGEVYGNQRSNGSGPSVPPGAGVPAGWGPAPAPGASRPLG